jgi:P-type Cu+ transporter
MASTGIQFRPRSSPPPAAGATTPLRVDGMTCGNCARHVTEALQKVPGVLAAPVDLTAAMARVVWKPGTSPDTAALEKAIVDAGFSIPARRSDGTASAPTSPWTSALRLGVPASALLLAGEWILGIGMRPWFLWFAFVLSTVVLAVVGRHFAVGAWRQLRRGESNMDTLVTLGAGSAWAFSTGALLTGTSAHLFFTEAVTIVTLISVGHWMESRMSERAGDALKSLLNLAPETARRLGPDGVEAEVPCSALMPGQRIVLRPGDRIPVDAEVLEGASAVEESMLTGESLPVSKSPGSRLFAGTLNRQGRLVARVQATGESTALAHIAAAVRRAQATRASVQRLADQISSVFVPVVVFLAVAAALMWFLQFDRMVGIQEGLGTWLWHSHPPASPAAAAVTVFCAVLIVACPCAMGLATPVALMAGINAAARRGILIRDAVALEKSGRLTVVAFDKTGTLTSGVPRVISSEVSPGSDAGADRTLAAALAAGSRHPLSRAVVDFVNPPPGSSFHLGHWEEKAGAGIEAELADATGRVRNLRLGSPAWLAGSGCDVSVFATAIEDGARRGQAAVVFAEGDTAKALFLVGDPLRPETPELLRRLAASGLEAHLVSGDSQAACLAVGGEAGLPAERIHGAQTPDSKAALLESLRRGGGRVAFVGDGINDAPALAAADLGIAVGSAADAAREAADIVLLRPGLDSVAEAIGLSQRTLGVIRQNLFWAFFYNAAAVPLAACGLMSPVLCAATMGLSDLVVIGNALRLRNRS